MNGLSRRRLLLFAAALPFAARSQSPSRTEGEVRKVDKAAGKITLKHGEIRNLDMPAMTMVFTVRDKALLEQVQVGDKVLFSAALENGVYLLTDLEPHR